MHCVALIAPSVGSPAAGELAPGGTPAVVRVLRSGFGRGWLGPEPIKGHGPHRCVFQHFALAAPVAADDGGAGLERARPRAVLAGVAGPVLGRGRLEGLYER